MIKKNIIVLYDKDIHKMFSSKDLDTLFMVGIRDGHPWKMQFQFNFMLLIPIMLQIFRSYYLEVA
jgi:hypothetical protein